jgi:hypothetical protein
VYGDGVMGVLHFRKWRREFEEHHDNDRTCRPSTSTTDVNAAERRTLFLKTEESTFRDLSAALELSILTLLNNVLEWKRSISTATKLLKIYDKYINVLGNYVAK